MFYIYIFNKGRILLLYDYLPLKSSWGIRYVKRKKIYFRFPKYQRLVFSRCLINVGEMNKHIYDSIDIQCLLCFRNSDHLSQLTTLQLCVWDCLLYWTGFPRAKNGLFFASLTSSIGHKVSIQIFVHKCTMVVTCLVEHKWVIAQLVTSELLDNTKKLVLN